MAKTAKSTAATRKAAPKTPEFDVREATVAKLQAAMTQGKVTSAELTEIYLDRINAYRAFNLVRETNPDALKIAADMDRERKAKGPRGPMHGVPVIIKDNMSTSDKMRTTVGVKALEKMRTPFEAEIVKRLRGHGAVILGKGNVPDFCDYMSSVMPSGFSAVGGVIHNPYTGEMYARGGGSSTGVAGSLAANLACVGFGSETQNSIQAPACNSAVVGIKPTVGLWSRAGIVPLAINQDTAGPMARTVFDAALLLGLIAGPDFGDLATMASLGHVHRDYTRFCTQAGLVGKRIGVSRGIFFERENLKEHYPVIEQALLKLHEAGAILVDPAEIPNSRAVDPMPSRVFRTDFKAAFNHFLKSVPDGPCKSMADVVAFNSKHGDKAIPYGMDLLEAAEATNGDWSEPEYHFDRARDIRLCREEGIDACLREHRLDAILAPMDRAAKMTGKAGYPAVSVPCGFTKDGVPVGISFVGTAWSEPTLIAIAHGAEQVLKARKPSKRTL